MNSSIPAPEPIDVPGEIAWVAAEASRLARDGGTPDERASYFARKQRLNAELARLADEDQLPTAVASSPEEQAGAEQAAQRTKAALCARGDLHCADWPLCGLEGHPHTDNHWEGRS